jgi:drug/metabolite transporter (DMT)-like permease
MASVIFFGFTTIVDKLMLEERLSSFSYFAAFVPPALVFCVCVLLFVPTGVSSFPCTIAFVAGLISAGGYFFYALSIRREEASRIAALTSLAPAFVAVLALFLVGEIFSVQSYTGVVLMILGSALISYKRNYAKKMIPVSLALILLATNLFYGVEQTISKISLDQLSFPTFLMMFMFGRILIVFPGLAVRSVRRKFVSEVRGLGRNFGLALILGSVTWTLGVILFFYGASLGPITLVSAASLITPLFTLFFAILVTKYLPRVLQEEIDRKTVALKFLAIILIILGTYFIIT